MFETLNMCILHVPWEAMSEAPSYLVLNSLNFSGAIAQIFPGLESSLSILVNALKLSTELQTLQKNKWILAPFRVRIIYHFIVYRTKKNTFFYFLKNQILHNYDNSNKNYNLTLYDCLVFVWLVGKWLFKTSWPASVWNYSRIQNVILVCILMGIVLILCGLSVLCHKIGHILQHWKLCSSAYADCISTPALNEFALVYSFPGSNLW